MVEDFDEVTAEKREEIRCYLAQRRASKSQQALSQRKTRKRRKSRKKKKVVSGMLE